MNEMIERLARLLCKLEGTERWDEFSAPGYEENARQVIAEMREATELMKELGAMVRHNRQPMGSPKDWNNNTDCAGIWRAMIDGALQ